MDLRQRAIRAAEERGALSEQDRERLERDRHEAIHGWLVRRLFRLMYRILDTTMDLTDITVTDEAVEGIDWRRGRVTANAGGLMFETQGIFDHEGRSLPLGDGDLKVSIPCAVCGAWSGPKSVGSLSMLGDLLSVWERCETCQAAAAATAAIAFPDLDSSCGAEDAPPNYPPLPSTPRVTVDRERMAARRAQGGGLEVAA